ncbi:MAG: hypothetical protein AB2799_14765 [Candidatus Thiodiazotropha sp.]
MLKPFLLIFNVADGERKNILDFLDTRHEVQNWYTFMPTGIIIISDLTAHDLQKMFLEGFPNRNHLVTEIPFGSNNGWLNKEVWEFINNPKPVGQ